MLDAASPAAAPAHLKLPLFRTPAEAFDYLRTKELLEAALALMPRCWVPLHHVSDEIKNSNHNWFTRQLKIDFKQAAIKACQNDWGAEIDPDLIERRLKRYYDIHHAEPRMFPNHYRINLNEWSNLVLIEERLHSLLHQEIARDITAVFKKGGLPSRYIDWHIHIKDRVLLEALPNLHYISPHEMYLLIPYPSGFYFVPQLAVYEAQHGLKRPKTRPDPSQDHSHTYRYGRGSLSYFPHPTPSPVG